MSDSTGLNGDEQLLKDRSYSPSSDRETAALQDDPERPDAEAGDRVRALPGTGGPDDSGDIEVSAEEIDVPRDTGAH